MVEITGGCLCGAVRFHATAEPIVARTCWCRVCQYFGAGSATVNVVFPKAAVVIEGEAGLSVYGSLADSGNRMQRRFCPTCGVQMFSESSGRPDAIVVRAGVLDDPNIAHPATTIWAAEAPEWAVFDEDIPRIDGQPT